MKKTIAVILSAIMIFCCIPFAVFAADTTDPADYEIPASAAEYTAITENITIGKENRDFFKAGKYVVCDNVTVTFEDLNTCYIPQNTIIYVADGGTINAVGSLVIDEFAMIVVKQGGTLKVASRLEVYRFGELYVEGTLKGAENVAYNENAKANVIVTFPSVVGSSVDGKISVSYATSSSNSLGEDAQGKLVYEKVPAEGATVKAPINRYFYVKVEIVEADGIDKYDDSLFKVYCNEFEIPFSMGSHPFVATSSAEISYGSWTKESDFLNTYSIYLPTGDGYAIYGRNGEQWTNGDTPKLKHGEAFSFRIEVDAEYDMSVYEVYIYNGYGWTNLDPTTDLSGIAPAKPDEYGYYHIREITGETTVYVTGIMANETLLMIGNILDMVRGVFEMFAGFFQEILGYLGNILGVGSVA